MNELLTAGPGPPCDPGEPRSPFSPLRPDVPGVPAAPGRPLGPCVIDREWIREERRNDHHAASSKYRHK